MSKDCIPKIETLKQIQIIFRHGIRTGFVNEIYPGDPNKDFMDQGLAQLTQRGRQQMYKLGQFLHQRYATLINYNPRSIYARSGGINRCLDSLSCFLASFCPPKGYYDWNPSLNWQPIPINTMPREMDTILHSSNHQEIFQRIQNPKLNEELMKKVRAIEQVTGVSFDNKFDFFCLIDGIIAQAEDGVTLSPDIEPHKQDMYDLTDQYFHEFIERPMDMVDTGYGLFEETVKNLQQSTTSEGRVKDGAIKCSVYSTSDTTVLSFMKILGIYNEKRMHFGATIVIELHEINEKPMIKLLYNKNTVQDPSLFNEVNLQGCSSFCTIENFIEAGERYTKWAKAIQI